MSGNTAAAEAHGAIIRHSTRRAAALLGALCVIACYSDTQEHFNFDDGISNPNSNAIAATVIHTSVESPNGLGKIMNGDARKIQTPSVKIYVIDLKTAAIRNSWSFNNEVGLGAQYRGHIDGFLGD